MTPQDNSPPRAGGPTPRSIGALFSQKVRELGHRPYLTFYDDATGERTELSYATFDNWASKAANMLTEELDAVPGTMVGLLAVGHWTSAVLAAAAWKVGAVVVFDAEAAARAQVLLVGEADAPDFAAHPGLVVQGSGIGGRVVGTAPGIGFGNEVLAFADDYDDPSVGLDQPALSGAAGDQTHAELLQAAWGAAGEAEHLLSTAALSGSTAAALLLAPALAGGSLVWCPSSVTDLTERIAAERVTAVITEDGSVSRV